MKVAQFSKRPRQVNYSSPAEYTQPVQLSSCPTELEVISNRESLYLFFSFKVINSAKLLVVNYSGKLSFKMENKMV